MAPFQVAVLDDYQGFADAHFDKLDADKYKVTSLKETLLPYNHADTPQSVKDALVSRLEPFDIICCMRERTPFPGDLVARLPSLKLFLSTSLRNKALDLEAFRARGIPVAGTVDKNRATAGTDSTTQHCVALILALARGVARDDAAVKRGRWQTSFATGLGGKFLGVVGLGRLGANVARIMAVAFGMRVLAWSPNLTQDKADERARELGLPVEDEKNGEKTFKSVSRDELFSTADVVSLHVVLSDRSRGMVTTADLNKMKPSSFFVNTSRGPLVVERDLLDHLSAGRIRGAALDVFDQEPLPLESEWRRRDWGTDGSSEVLLTPHMGYVEEATLGSWYEQQVANILRWEAGEPLEVPL